MARMTAVKPLFAVRSRSNVSDAVMRRRAKSPDSRNTRASHSTDVTNFRARRTLSSLDESVLHSVESGHAHPTGESWLGVTFDVNGRRWTWDCRVLSGRFAIYTLAVNHRPDTKVAVARGLKEAESIVEDTAL